MIDDHALVSQVKRGDMQAFKLLIRQHEKLVLHMIARIVKNEEDRRELCQDVFLKVHEKLGDFAFQSRLSTWIATIAYRTAINHLRKAKQQYTDLPDESDFNEYFIEEMNPENTLAENDTEAFVLKVAEALPVQYKTVLLLYHVQGMTYPEICTVMEMPEGTVKSYLFRARQLLKEKLKNYLGKEDLL